MVKELEDFRRAFLSYLLNPSKANENKLYEVSLELSSYATRLAQRKHTNPGADEASTELESLITEALTDISITQSKSDNLDGFINIVVKKDKTLKNTGPGAVLTVVWDLLNCKVVDDNQFNVLTTTYARELDGYRLRNECDAPNTHNSHNFFSSKVPNKKQEMEYPIWLIIIFCTPIVGQLGFLFYKLLDFCFPLDNDEAEHPKDLQI